MQERKSEAIWLFYKDNKNIVPSQRQQDLSNPKIVKRYFYNNLFVIFQSGANKF